MSLKHDGLSQLADLAREAYGVELYYPVKRRGVRRRLDPNWTAIAWLEAQQMTETEIEDVQQTTYDISDGLRVQRALGWYSAKRNGHYARPMFQIIPVDASSSHQVPYSNPCPECLDFSRSWACPVHPELEYDRRHGWQRPGADEVAIHLPTEATPAAERLADTIRRAFEQVGSGAFSWGEPSDEQNRFWASTPAPVDPPSVTREDPRLIVDRSFPRYIDAEALRARVDLTAQPGDLARLILEAPRAQDTSFTAGAFTLQVDGETVEGVRSFTINVSETEAPDGR
jgi:hypothetical protein